MSSIESPLGEVIRLVDALRTVEGICKFYSVRYFNVVDIDRIAVYNAQNDNFHFFKWSSDGQYVYNGSADSIPNWLGERMAI